ncbi:MAG: antitoxin Xre/MbcA/ParS toxin-binding domain-containing protein [Polyangiaceae bacterium]
MASRGAIGFYSPDEAHLWLFSPQRLLGGATPADRIEQDKVDDVLALIKQLQDGAFV